MLGLVTFLAVITAAVVAVAVIYNQLVAFKNRYLNAFAQIEVQLKRRHDLIPNLVETTRAYLQHEKQTLEAVINARNQAVAGLQAAVKDPGNAQVVDQLSSAERALSGALGRLSVVVEAYPDLKANQNVAQMFEELTTTENRVSFARQAYNDQVMGYNTYRQSFPAVVFSGLFGHTKDATLLQFEDRAALQAVPKVSF